MSARRWHTVWTVAIVAGLLGFAIVPTSIVESGLRVCLWYNAFGWDCPGCGMTRAASSLMHGRLAEAFAHNRLVVIVFPLLCLHAWSLVRPRRPSNASGSSEPSNPVGSFPAP